MIRMEVNSHYRLVVGFLIALVLVGSMDTDGNGVTQANKLRSEAIALRHKGDYTSALNYLERALALRPDHPTFMYEISQLNQLVGENQKALEWLRRIVDMGLIYHPEKDTIFKGLVEETEFQQIMKAVKWNSSSLMTATKAFTLVHENPVSEGIAFDAGSNRFFISSVGSRRILVRAVAGIDEVFVPESDSVWSILGMKVDLGLNSLWACAAALPQMVGYDSSMEGKSALLKIDLTSGRLIKRYVLDNFREKHLLGDLTITPDGDVYVTDGRAPVIYRLDHEKDTFEEFVRSTEFVNLQGIDYSPEHNVLYAADYSRGIFQIDITTRTITLLPPCEGTTLLGIDGLYLYQGKVIAIQNGVNPNRVVKLGVDHKRPRITSWEVLEANHPAFDEPTLGVVVGSDFFFIANSQWEKGGKTDMSFNNTVVLKLSLE